LGEGVSEVIRQPQINSAWARQKVARVKQTLEEQGKWDKQIAGVARSTANPWYYRTRALQVMQLYGPAPTPDLLLRLSQDESEVVRAKAAELMGLHTDEATHDRLIALLDDQDRTVRRRACEALLRAGQAAPLAKLTRSLTSDDRWEAFAARRILEQTPIEEWREQVLSSNDQRVFVQGALALLVAYPTEENATAVLHRFAELMGSFISDRNFIDMLRVAQVAFHRAPIKADQFQLLVGKLGEEFPSSDTIMNRELVRLLAHLQVTDAIPRYVAFLSSADPGYAEKLHLALHLRFIPDGWPAGQMIEVIKFYEDAKKQPHTGESYKAYLSNVERDFARSLSPVEGRQVLARGAEWPSAATGALYGLPQNLDYETFRLLKNLDQQLGRATDDAAAMLRVGILAVMARSGDERAFAYLRQVWENEPERRDKAAMGLAQKPDGDNWSILVRSLSVLEGHSAVEVLRQLRGVDQRSTDPEAVRQVILCALRSGHQGAQHATALLQHWTGESLLDDQATPELRVKAWQDWYAATYPDRPRAELPVAAQDSKWKFDELLTHLASDAGSTGSAEKGAAVFEKAQCAKCHRFGTRGENLGPDLTSLAKRFRKQEVLESILYPSHVISDQYSAKSVTTTNGTTYTGVVLPGAAGEKIIVQANGEKKVVKESQIESTTPSSKSSMPDNLLDPLSLEEISDLFAYLGMLPTPSLTRKNAEPERKKSTLLQRR
jgi:putative heme-binding domain-containing protein